MKTLIQEQLLLVAGGNDENQNDVPATEEVPVVAPEVIVEETLLQRAGAFLSKMAFGCC
ncbi:MAG: hypothetical protein JSS07_04615 [Proteobacteria bacterium]|nr:hypothetical protein [Pseudomonadota bacterium]